MREPTEMELRVCDAIWADIAAQASFSRKSVNYPNEVCVDGDFDLLHAARAGMRAMREPNDRMLMCSYYPDVKAAKRREIYTAMIDSASPPIDGESNG